MRCRTFAVVLLSLTGPALAADAPVSFREQVAPILVRSCLGCHDDKKAANGLNMTTFARLKKGGKSAGTDILEPGDPDASVLIESVRPDASPRMPYKQPPLKDRDIRTLETWVKEGARFDGPSETETPIASLFDPLRNLPSVPLKAPAADAVTSLAFSPDGSTLAATAGRRVLFYDAATGKLRRADDGPAALLNSLRYAPDGKTLVAAGGRAGMFGLVGRFDLATQKWTEARGHTDSILAVAFAADGQSLATAGYDRQVILWDLATLKPVRALKDHTDSVYAVAFAPDGKTLASAGADRTVKLWDVATGRKLKTLSDATAELYAVIFAPDGSTLFAAGVDRTIRAWRVSDKDAPLIKTAFAHDAAVLRLVASADGKTLVSSGEDRAVKLWDLATLSPRSALERQPDWPQAIAFAPDGKRLAVGRYDGSVGVYDAATGALAFAFTTSPQPAQAAAPPAKPALVRNATLNPPSPRGATRGTTVRLTLTGEGAGRATEVVFAEPGLSATIVAADKPNPNRLDAVLTIAADARVGTHRLGVVTPLGVPDFVAFAVEAYPVAAESEPNDDPAAFKSITLPATLVGTIDKPGDVDHFRFESKQGRQLVFNSTGPALGSKLRGVLTLLDDRGRTIAEAGGDDGDPNLIATVPADGAYTLRVADADYGGSGEHFYRIAAGTLPYLETVFPLGVVPGQPREIAVLGHNLQGIGTVRVSPAAGAEPGALVEVPVVLDGGSRPAKGRTVVVCDGPQSVEKEPNDDPSKAEPIAAPGGVSARIGREGDVDHFRFPAKKGERVILDVFGRRLGTPIDPVIEILDTQGHPVPRAVLRPVAETEVAFRDHNSTVTGIRLTHWSELAIDDTVLIGREVARVFALPKNPDDDCQFWADQTQRLGFLETTPEHHPMSQPIYKVEVHPPGTTFPPGGLAPVTLNYRNDDGGPSFNKDSRLTFDPPADGEFLVRVADVRALGGESYGYHLVVRRPRPGFSVAVSPENPNVPRGGTTLVTVRINRRDGYDGPVDVSAEGLPPGITSAPVRVERDATTAVLSLSADPSAPAFSPPTWRILARGATAPEARREFDPGGPRGGWVTVTPGPNLKVVATPTRVAIRPGREVTMKLAVERGPAFSGRVPIDVRNLPHGVRVLNIGLNGVLVTETQTERTVTLYAEPWVGAMERPFYAVGKAEAAATEHSSAPITLAVEPAPATASAAEH